ncbi:nicotinate-nucleotide adenylyltransferase [Pseudoalteromonas atlantica]|uniref:nicotinate-nucleotide adenylyltransferase n=1 Tax=Pseudoalteromonas atlantica TaxID=288 RepID=UPI0037354DE7
MIALFGGTFDPIHLGHINMAKQCVEHLNLRNLQFMPCAIPAHKAVPGISNEDRIAMLQAAIETYDYFSLDLRELKRQGPSYSLLSLQELREEHPNDPILFLIGLDSFNTLDKWFEWQTITQLCHLVVFQRPNQNMNLSPQLIEYKKQALTTSPDTLRLECAGRLYFLPGKIMDIASSDIRQKLKKGQSCGELLPTAVSHYIGEQQLYLSGE